MGGIRGIRRAARPRPKRLPSHGRNVEGAGWVMVIDAHGDKLLRCKHCEKTMPVTLWWRHGTSDDPHLPV